MKRLTTEEYIKRAIEKYNDLYDYSEVEYINAKTKIKIRCRRCGKIFWQLPFAHLNGQGCSSCNGGVKKDKNYFIIKAIKEHGNLYDYSEGDYINSRTPYKIKCKKCDKYFFQTPDNHMRGQGCPWCAGKTKIQKLLLNKQI